MFSSRSNCLLGIENSGAGRGFCCRRIHYGFSLKVSNFGIEDPVVGLCDPKSGEKLQKSLPKPEQFKKIQ